MLFVDDDQHGFQATQSPISPPVAGQFGRSAREVAGVVLRFCLKAFQQGECIRSGTGESNDHFAVEDLADLASVPLEDGGIVRHLPVASDGNRAIVPHSQDRGRVRLGTGAGHGMFRLGQ